VGDEGIRHSIATEERDEQDETYRKLLKEKVIWLAKDMPSKGESVDRAPWKKKMYPGKLVSSELVDNRYFKSEEFLDKDYKRVVGDNGRTHWEDDKGNKYFLDDPIEQTQYKLVIEVLDGEKAGDWAWVFAPHRFGYKKDGTPFGNRLKIALAIDENFDASLGIEDDNSDLLYKPFYFTAQPKEDAKYCKVTDFLPMDDSDKVKYVLGATEAVAKPDDEDVPW